MPEQDGKWVTIKGTHVFIKDGESVEDAMARQFKDDYYAYVRKGPVYKVIKLSELEKYKSDGYTETYNQPDFDELFKYVDDIDIEHRSYDAINNDFQQMYRIRSIGFGYGLRDFLFERLMNRYADYQQSLAEEYLSDVGHYQDKNLMVEGVALNTNPNYEESKKLRSQGSHEPEAAAYTQNCQRCVQAFVLQWCHGYDVEAMPCERYWSDKEGMFKSTGNDTLLKNYALSGGYDRLRDGKESSYTCWDAAIFNPYDVRKTHMNSKNIEDEIGYAGTEDQWRWIKRTVKQAGHGACYIVTVSWKGTRNDDGHYSAHAFCVVNENGKVKCIDPQSGTECSEYFTEKQIKSNRTEIFRADTCRLNGEVMNLVIKK